MKTIYLATPYSHKNKEVMEKRYWDVNKATSLLMNYDNNLAIYSPISQTHQIAQKHHLPTDWQYWKNICETFIECTDEVWVFCTDGWFTSIGVNGEIDYGFENDKKIVFFHMIDNDIEILYEIESNQIQNKTNIKEMKDEAFTVINEKQENYI